MAIRGAAGAPVKPGAEKKPGGFSFLSKSEAPIEIRADSFAADNQTRVAVFTGHVVAVQGAATMTCDVMEIRYAEGGGDDRIEKVIARGNVVLVQEDKRATGNEATYDGRARTVVLTGDPEVWQGADHLVGKSITFFVDEDRVAVSGSPGEKVRVTLYPKKEGAKPGTKTP
jgi:lipopolysaccharide export system protein LptA